VCYLAGYKDSYQNEKFMRGCRFLEAELQDMDRVLSGQYVSCPFLLFLFVLPVNILCLRFNVPS